MLIVEEVFKFTLLANNLFKLARLFMYFQIFEKALKLTIYVFASLFYIFTILQMLNHFFISSSKLASILMILTFKLKHG